MSDPPRFSPQTFSVPYNFLLYMAENPSTLEVFLKMRQTCKFIAAKNKIMYLSNLYYGNCRNKPIVKNVDKDDDARRFWVFSWIIVGRKIDQSEFFRFSQKKLTIQSCVLSMHDFHLLIAENTVTEFELKFASIEDCTADMILEKLPNVTTFMYVDRKEIWTKETLENLNKLQRNFKFKICGVEIYHTSDSFSPMNLVEFALKNGESKSRFGFSINNFSFQQFATETENWNNANEKNQIIIREDGFLLTYF